jgi:ArsR family transcriptional regulator, arsenate/arsenite/antimonite-responsive transcriptional repressor
MASAAVPSSSRRKVPPRKAGGVSPAAHHKARILQALAHPLRVSIFELLADGEKTVGDIVTFLGTKSANTSRHLALLRNAGLVSTRKEGLNVYYSIKMPCLLPMLSCIAHAICTLADEHRDIAACLRK